MLKRSIFIKLMLIFRCPYIYELGSTSRKRGGERAADWTDIQIAGKIARYAKKKRERGKRDKDKGADREPDSKRYIDLYIQACRYLAIDL